MGSYARGGITIVSVDGSVVEAKGDWTYCIGNPKREAIPGTSKVVDFKETVQVPFIEGAVTDGRDLDLDAFTSAKGVTVTVVLANGKIITGNDMWFAGEGTVSTGEGEIPVRFESSSKLEEMSATE